MKSLARFRPLVLVLLLVVSHLALVSHVTAHFEPQWEECELCVSQGQTLAAVPVHAAAASADEAEVTTRFDHRQGPVPFRFSHEHRQRAPPAPSH